MILSPRRTIQRLLYRGGSVAGLVCQNLQNGLDVIVGRPHPAPRDRPRQSFQAYWLQQIVNAAGLESLDGVGVVGGGHDYMRFHLRLTEYLEALPVGKFDIHENDIGRSMRAEPFYGALDGIRDSDDLDVRKISGQRPGQHVSGHDLVFYNQCFHNKGRITEYWSSLSRTIMDFPATSLYLCRRYFCPSPAERGGVSLGRLPFVTTMLLLVV